MTDAVDVNGDPQTGEFLTGLACSRIESLEKHLEIIVCGFVTDNCTTMEEQEIWLRKLNPT